MWSLGSRLLLPQLIHSWFISSPPEIHPSVLSTVRPCLLHLPESPRAFLKALSLYPGSFDSWTEAPGALTW